MALRVESTSSATTFLITIPLNLLSQLTCVGGVNMLNLVLTSRKALSLVISVLLFGSQWNGGMTAGSIMVGVGTIAYAMASRTKQSSKSIPEAKGEGEQLVSKIKNE
jgi:UDP-xylose/UDP-N-acetylglucosamine transporter B4